MRAVKLIGFCIVVCSSLSALAATSPAVVLGERALREECSAFSEAGMRECLAKKVDKSQKTLQQAEKQAAGVLAKWDEEHQYINQSKTRLAISNKVFVKYRETHCDFLASLSGGGAGNSHEIGRLACVAELNNRRAQQLLDAVSDLPLK